MPQSLTLPQPASSRLTRVLLLVACLLIAFLPSLVGGRFGPGDWYQSLAKSSLTPPGWVFPVAWTALYFMIGVSLFLYLTGPGRSEVLPLALFTVQLVLNALWSYLFFGLHEPGLALVDIAALWLAILATTLTFWYRRPAAGALLLPYLGWVTFASYLNFAVWRLN